MATDAKGHTVAVNGDDPDFVSDLAALSLSIRDVVYVANTTARTAAAAALSPSASNPLYVHRADAAAGRNLEVTRDGTTWSVIAVDDDTGWISTPGFTAAAGFTLGTKWVRRRYGMVSLQITVATTSAITAGNISNTAVLNVPSGYRVGQHNGHLGGGYSGPGLTAYVDLDNTIKMTSLDQSLAASDSFNIFGVYML